MNSIKLTAPAKVNLFLKVLDKRKDSYHNILTLFERISLEDEIKITKIRKGITISSDKFITRNPKENIIYKAADLILRHKKLNYGVSITIKKKIPIAAGLGGGSSDAASTLIGMDRLFGLKLTGRELVSLAGQLGADVPFFILNASFAIGRLRGDRLTPVRTDVTLWHLLIYPGFKTQTKDVYGAFDRLAGKESKGLTRKSDDVKIQLPLQDCMDFDDFEAILYNDLQNIAVVKKTILGNIIERLAFSLSKKFIVSGSGPSVFCLYRTRKGVEAARRMIFDNIRPAERKNWQVFIARTSV